MIQKEIKKLASEIIGDGQTPNKFFVTVSPYAKVYKNDDYDPEMELVDGFEDCNIDEYTITFGAFDTYEEACEAYDDIELDPYLGQCQVVIEDRLTGQIKEKCLEQIIKVDYVFTENDDSKFFGYTK
jgi:hypothetical protein